MQVSFVLATAVLFLADRTVIVAKIGRVEFTHGKCHIVEYSARIILVGNYAFLVGNGILGCVDKILRRADYTNYRENANGNYQFPLSSLATRKMTVKPNRNALGNVIATATTRARITLVLFYDLC